VHANNKQIKLFSFTAKGPFAHTESELITKQFGHYTHAEMPWMGNQPNL
jgi:hypothetical protein